MRDYEEQYADSADALQPIKQVRKISVRRLNTGFKNQADAKECVKEKWDINNNYQDPNRQGTVVKSVDNLIVDLCAGMKIQLQIEMVHQKKSYRHNTGQTMDAPCKKVRVHKSLLTKKNIKQTLKN
jgi:hypothetical protein